MILKRDLSPPRCRKNEAQERLEGVRKAALLTTGATNLLNSFPVRVDVQTYDISAERTYGTFLIQHITATMRFVGSWYPSRSTTSGFQESAFPTEKLMFILSALFPLSGKATSGRYFTLESWTRKSVDQDGLFDLGLPVKNILTSNSGSSSSFSKIASRYGAGKLWITETLVLVKAIYI